MSMSLKQELETWAGALKAYDEEDYEGALNRFMMIGESSKIQVNVGLIYATVGNHEEAVEAFRVATGYDQFLAVAYFQCGVSNFLIGRYEEAYQDFEDAILYLRGNQAIMYEQLGLKFTLHSAEVLFNKGLCLIYLGQSEDGLAVMTEAAKEKSIDEHNVIEEAIRDQGEGYTVFSIPIGVLYRPSESKMKNAKAKDYMGKAKLVATSDARDAYVSFVGSTRLAQGLTPSGAPLPADRPTPPSEGSNDRPAMGRSKTIESPRSDRKDPQRSATIPATKGGDKSLPNMPVRGLTIRRPPDGTPGISRGGTIKAAPPPKLELSGLPTPPADTLNRGLTFRSPPQVAGRLPERDRGAPRDDVVFNGLSAGDAGSGGGMMSPRSEELLDAYFESYDRSDIPPVPPLPAMPEIPNTGANAKLAQWARGALESGPPPFAYNGGPSDRAGVPSTYLSNSSSNGDVQPNSNASPRMGRGVGTIRRKITRRATTKNDRYVPVQYEEEDGSDVDFEEVFELVKIRVKLHYRDDVRGMALTPDVSFDEFVDKVTRKFNKSFAGLGMKFKDEDGGQITLRDESDYDLAIETAREAAKGRPEGKLEVWCVDL